MRFVLVHGAFVGGWIWAPLAERLEERGHTVETPDLPGSGADDTPAEDVSLDAYAKRICDLIEGDAAPSILVGNSMGGVVITEAAARRPERVKRLVYAAAFLPGDGQSLKDLTELPEGADDLVQANVTVSGNPPVGSLPDEVHRKANLACAPEVIDWAVERTSSQAMAPLTEAVSVTNELERIPRTYVICTRDTSIPPALQRRMATDREVTDVVELDTDHHPQLSKVDELAEILHLRARDEVVA